MKIGTNRNQVRQDQIYNQSVETGISYGSTKTATVNTISTIQTDFTATGLESQTTYLLGAYVNSSVGNS